jgi:hypothetical protein
VERRILLQEDLERRTIAVSVTASKFTAQTMAKALQSVLHQIQEAHKKAKTPHGRQSVEKLMNHGANTSTIPLDGNTRLFDRIAKKWNVDYSFHKTGPGKYLLLFKTGQADAITACFSDYTKKMMSRKRRQPFREQFDKVAEQARARPQEREHERTRGAARDER